MARSERTRSDPAAWPWKNPWPPVAVGLGLALACIFLPESLGTTGTVVRVALLVAGLLAAGGGVWLRLHFAGRTVNERATSAGLLALAALVPVLAFAACPAAWDSIRLFLGVLTAVTLSGGVLVLLPPVALRTAISVLVLLHFGGILTAVTSPAPPSGQQLWLSNQLWSRFYRFYLQFMYLNNAYHFYSPEPGPAPLLWFHLDYADGSERWVRLPERQQFHTRQEYQRRLALTESVNQLNPPMPVPPFFQARRMLAGGMNMNGMQPMGMLPVEKGTLFIPPMTGADASLQFRIPNPYSAFLTAAYVRHVVHDFPSEKDPTAEVTGVKVYRTVHLILDASMMADGMSPTDPTLYKPYYQGEFDKDGNLKDPTNDPFLYWLIPIQWYPEKQLPANFPKDDPSIVFAEKYDPAYGGKMLLIDFTKIHVQRKAKKSGS
jgi:hypothetical protein